MIKSIKELSQEIYAVNKSKGFWDEERNTGELLMLIVSELGEAIEAHRKGHFCEVKSQEDKHLLLSKDTETFKAQFELKVKDTYEDEIADAVIRLLDLAAGQHIDLEWHILAKLSYNKTRKRLHGKRY